MATKLPYVTQPGSVVKVFQKVKEARTPDRFTHDFLETKLGFRGGNYRQFVPFAKKLGLLNTDGSPTDLYKKYRNSATSAAAMAAALKRGYREAFERNEYAGNLDKEKFKGLVVEITGRESSDRVVQLTCQTFEALKGLADFEAKLDMDKKGPQDQVPPPHEEKPDLRDFDLNLSYAINLVLPKTDDPGVFNAIFRALRDNLLNK